jgi:hypothetical protein
VEGNVGIYCRGEHVSMLIKHHIVKLYDEVEV